ncbi:peptidase [Aphanothece hegewaldii CCALA 016]|uniref:Peptidase n=1 Tax=Aphanothece hegewaldii CCALA 016 TaxID=2107694 RepID=A0A2T1LY84_9CHRO|nr:PPC domain-containing protein [Aphanothece hegewaldii]PSF37321.1 peptidase [Aphanothece hegewaldii CCALA 016]
MTKFSAYRWSISLLFGLSSYFFGFKTLSTQAESLYSPIPLTSINEVSDTLSDKDIPTGEGGFARDYIVNLKEGDQLAVDLISDDFDAIVVLLSADGTTVAENDDGPDGSTNSLLFSRITESGKYIIRVQAFGETGSGKFILKVSRLRPTN